VNIFHLEGSGVWPKNGFTQERRKIYFRTSLEKFQDYKYAWHVQIYKYIGIYTYKRNLKKNVHVECVHIL
jgi:hypothetical protein